MGARSRYVPGTFCWTDLSAPDPDAAKVFYGALFGWQAEDIPVGEDRVYSLMRLDGKVVAAISAQPEQQREAGVPALWNSYVAVDSADQTLERAKQLGGTAHTGAFDVMKAGRMGVIEDPQGAYVIAWQPGERQGADLVNAPGALVWNELQSGDIDGSVAFYGELFGWQLEQFDAMRDRYLTIKIGENSNGGIRGPGPAGTPPHWLVYFGSADLDASLAQLGALGGRALSDPVDIGVARLAVVQDPQGAVFALYDGQLAP